MTIGINITERTDQGVPALAGDSDLTLGLLGVTERGPLNRPIIISGEAEFKRIFGDYITTGFASYAYAGFRLNGGRRAYVSRIYGTGGVAAIVTLVDRAVSPAATLEVSAAYKGSADKGVWGNSLKVTIADNAADVSLFDLTVFLSGEKKEVWRGLTPATAESAINDSENGSEFIKVVNKASVTVAPNNNPANQSLTALASGANPAAPTTGNLTGTQGDLSGIFAFDGKPITHLICPESQDITFQASLEAYCANLGLVVAIFSLPKGTSVSGAITAGGLRQLAISYAACYLGHITVIDPIGTTNNPVKVVCPDGHIAGVYARTWRTRGVHKAPAGVIDGALRGALAVDVDVANDTNLTLVAEAGVNALRSIPGYGRVVMVSRTLSKDTRWTYVNVRNLFNYVKRALKDGLLWVQQEPNDLMLQRKVAKDVVLPFMMGLYHQGAFGSGKASDVFTIKCDGDNNPESEVDLGNFHLDITMYPSKPAESIYISIGQQKSGGSSVKES